MSTQNRLSVLIPALNEQATIAEVIRRVAAARGTLANWELEIVVCDDGSTDDTARVVESTAMQVDGVKLVRHPRNRGKGAAIRSALRAASGDYVLVQDADLEYDVSDYRALLDKAEAGAAAVYGSRFLRRFRPRGMALANFLGNKLLTVVANVLYGTAITDEATCYKLVRTDVLRALELRCEGFAFCPEVTSKLGIAGVAIVEVPIGYEGRTATEGKKIRWHHAIEAIAVMVSLRFPWRRLPEATGIASPRVLPPA